MSTRFCGDRIFAQSIEGFPNYVKDGAQLYFYDTSQQYHLVSGVWTLFSAGSGSIIQNGITGAGTDQRVAKFVSPSGIGDSPIFISGGSAYLLGNTGFFGIGQAPAVQLDTIGLIANRPGYATLTATSSLSSSFSYAKLDSNSNIPSDRRFSLIAGQVPGQIQFLEWVSNTGSGILVNNSGLNRLAADWIPGSGDMIGLIYDGLHWQEFCRKTVSGINTTTQTITNAITGSGTTLTIPIFSSSSGIANSTIVFSLIGGTNYYQSNNAFRATSLIRGNITSTFTTGDVSSVGGVTDYIVVNSDLNGDSYNRRFTLGAGILAGQQKLIQGGTGNCVLPNSGIVKLASDWLSASGAQLKVNYDGTYWYEEYRFPPNTGASSITNAITGVGVSSYVPKFISPSGINASNAFFDSSNNLILLSGKLGVANSTPFVSLHVGGAVAVTRGFSGPLVSGIVSTTIPTNNSYLKINSQAQSPENTFLVFDVGTQGQYLTLEMGTGFVTIKNNSGLMRLASDWLPGSGDTLSLVYNGESEWLELGRKVYSGVCQPYLMTTGISNAYLGKTQLVAGSKVISNNSATSNTLLFVVRETPSAILGNISSFISGSNIVIFSDNALETSTINWKLEKFNY